VEVEADVMVDGGVFAKFRLWSVCTVARSVG